MANSSNQSTLFIFDYHKCTFTNDVLIRYCGTFIFVVGILSTLLSICVFVRKPLRSKSCCFYFLILAISDSIHLTTMTIEHLPFSFHLDLIIIHSVLCKLIIFLIYFSNHLSNIVLTLASIDRFILIYYPSRAKSYCRIRNAKWLVLIVIVVLFISNGHILYGYERIPIENPPSPTSYDCNIHEEKSFYKKVFHFYDSYIESVFLVLIPFILMSLCSVMIIVQIVRTRNTIFQSTRANKDTKDNGKTRLRDKDIQLCCMLIATSFAFLLLCLPAEINDTFNNAGRERSCWPWFRKVILMLMQQIYYAGHFYIYTLTGQIFREHLYDMICARFRQHPSSNQSAPPRVRVPPSPMVEMHSGFDTTSQPLTQTNQVELTGKVLCNDSPRALANTKLLPHS